MKKELIICKDPKSPISEIFRTLRTNIQFMNAGKDSKTILVTSTFPGEGKSWASSNLAAIFAQTGKKIILIDSDMRKGRQYAILGVSPTPGLSNYLSGVGTNKENLKSCIQKTEVENLDIMVAGNIPPNPSELLSSEAMLDLLEKVKKLYDIVIIDGTPCQLVADSLILARVVDSTIVVTAYKSTKKKDLQRVITGINNVGGKIFGVILNKIPVPAKKYEQSYYYGSTSEGHKKEEKNETEVTVQEEVTNVKRGRGRPPKNKIETEVTVQEEATNVKRGRGRPPKNKIETKVTVQEEITNVKRGRGRPPKSKVEEIKQEFSEPEKIEEFTKQTKKLKKTKKGAEPGKNIVIPLFDEIVTVDKQSQTLKKWQKAQ